MPTHFSKCSGLLIRIDSKIGFENINDDYFFISFILIYLLLRAECKGTCCRHCRQDSLRSQDIVSSGIQSAHRWDLQRIHRDKYRWVCVPEMNTGHSSRISRARHRHPRTHTARCHDPHTCQRLRSQHHWSIETPGHRDHSGSCGEEDTGCHPDTC